MRARGRGRLLGFALVALLASTTGIPVAAASDPAAPASSTSTSSSGDGNQTGSITAGGPTPVVAPPDDPLITFSEFPVGTYITNQYEYEGVIFSGVSSTPEIFPDGANPTSPILEGGPYYTGDIAGQFVIPGTTTPGTVDTFSLDIGYIDSPGSTSVEVFGIGGQPLGSIVVNAWGIVHVTSNYPGASSFLVHENFYEPAGFAIDNLEYPMPTGGGTSLVNLLGMGDSYSSGEANPPYEDSTGCHRSPAAYAHVLANANGWNLTRFVACTGATSTDFMSTGQNGEPSQYAQLVALRQAGAGPNAITFTLGGDDIGFASIIKYCIAERISGATDLYDMIFNGGSGSSCADDQSFAPYTQETVENEYAPLVETFRRLSDAAGPDVSIMAADYPQIFPPNSDQQTCAQLRPWFTKDDQSWFRLLTVILDNKELEAAHDAGINGVNVLHQFETHAICDSGGAWLNGVTTVNGWHDPTGSFHPTADGQVGYAQAFADYINNAIASGAPLTSAGLPKDPNDPPGPDGNPNLHLTLGPLTITAPVDQPGCVDVVQGGEEVTVTGDGYAPGASVPLNLVDADKSGASQHVSLGTLTADGNGHINATVRLPLGMAGITPDGATGSMAYLQALGAGANAAQQLNNELVNVAPHGSDCGVVSPLPFQGFAAPVTNYPAVNAAQAGSTIPVKFSLAGVPGTTADALAPGYPQSAPVGCTDPAQLTTGQPTSATSTGSQSGDSERYNYLWATDPSWTGCRELIVRLADGSYHRAIVNFTKR